MSQLLPPVVPTVQPAAEAHQHQPGSHAQARDEGRLPDDAGDLLRNASCLPRGRGLACLQGYKEKFGMKLSSLMKSIRFNSPLFIKRLLRSRVSLETQSLTPKM